MLEMTSDPIITFIFQADKMYKSVDLGLCEGDCHRLPVMILLLCVSITGRGADIKTCIDLKPGYLLSSRLVTPVFL